MTTLSRNALQRRKLAGSVARHLLVITAALIVATPFIWMISISLSPASEVFSWPPHLIPSQLQFRNYADALVEYDFARYFWNSLTVAVIATICVILFDSMAGYAFAHLHFRGAQLIYLGIVITIMIPMQVTMIPLFVMFKNMPLVGGNDILRSGGRGWSIPIPA